LKHCQQGSFFDPEKVYCTREIQPYNFLNSKTFAAILFWSILWGNISRAAAVLLPLASSVKAAVPPKGPMGFCLILNIKTKRVTIGQDTLDYKTRLQAFEL
jgi:hypothetical protein